MLLCFIFEDGGIEGGGEEGDERMIREKTEDEIRCGCGGVVRLYGRKANSRVGGAGFDSREVGIRVLFI